MPRDRSSDSDSLTRFLVALPLAGMLFWITGCSSVTLADQARLAQPGMVFSDSPVRSDTASLLSSVEPGTDNRGGAAASGCTACR